MRRWEDYITGNAQEWDSKRMPVAGPRRERHDARRRLREHGVMLTLIQNSVDDLYGSFNYLVSSVKGGYKDLPHVFAEGPLKYKST